VIPIKVAGQSGPGVIQAFTQPGSIHLTSLPPLALYVHFPWCVRKCPYCDFNSHEWKGEAFPENEYLDALRADLELALPLVWGRQVHTVFIGGCRTCARFCRSMPTPRSLSKPTPAPSKRTSSRSFARVA
jgi:hypothetical protein